MSDIRVEPPPPEAGSASEEELQNLYREWLSKEPYLEFDIIGRSFFPSEGIETLTLRAMLYDIEGIPEYVAARAWKPEFGYNYDALLSYATRRIDYFRDGKLFESDNSPSYSGRMYFGGACVGPRDGRLNLLFAQQSGRLMVDYAAQFEPKEGISWVSINGPNDFSIQKMDCAEGQEYWKEGGAFTPCVCRDWGPGNPYNDNMVAWRQGFVSAARTDDHTDGDKLSSFVDGAKALMPFVLWDARINLEIQELESTEYEVVSVTFRYGPDFYDSFQIVLARKRKQDYWFLIYDAEVDHLGMDEVTIYGFEAPHLLKRSGSEPESYEDQVVDLNELPWEASPETQLEP